MTSPSGDQHPIAYGDYEAVVVESGATLRHLTYGGRPLLAGFGEDEVPNGGRGQVLVPWPNRIRDGQYTFGGTSYQLGLSEAGRHNASHGLVRWTSWRLLEGDAASVRMGYRVLAQSGYPWTLDVEVDYALSDHGLRVTLSATNLADSPAPFAAGFHPYLSAASPTVDDDVLTLPVSDRLLTDAERKLPTGASEPVAGTAYDFSTGQRLGDVVLDDPFRRTTGPVRLVAPDGHGVELWADDAFGWFQAYTADDTGTPRAALAVEPMTAPPDAFNSGTDLLTLEPAEVFRASWGIRTIV